MFRNVWKEGKVIGRVDRSKEFNPEMPEIVCELPCGHKEVFWAQGLEDEEYIKRTEAIKDKAPKYSLPNNW
jgi:hypothetical protein